MATASALAALRRRIDEIEGNAPAPFTGAGVPARGERTFRPDFGRQDAPAVLSLGLPLDAAFREGGFPCWGSHEVVGFEAGDSAAALGFSLALLARLFARDEAAKALLVQENMAARENGGIYGPGLKTFGIDPDRILLVCARKGSEALWVVEEGLRSGAVAAVLAELWDGSRRLDHSVTRRFNLAGRRTGTLALLVTRHLLGTSAALTRWRVRSAGTRGPSRLLGRPAFLLGLARNRCGRTGTWTVEWDCHECCFLAPAADRLPLAPSAHDRPSGETGAQPEWVRAFG